MQDEQNFKRWATYSMWHRWRSVLRFVRNPDIAKGLGMIDLDNTIWIDYRKKNAQGDVVFEPLSVIEAAMDSDKEKPAQVLARFGELCNRPAYVVRYTPAGHPNPAYPEYPDLEDISAFRVRRVWPNPDRGYREMSPHDYAHWLVQLRELQTRAFLRSQEWELPL